MQAKSLSNLLPSLSIERDILRLPYSLVSWSFSKKIISFSVIGQLLSSLSRLLLFLLFGTVGPVVIVVTGDCVVAAEVATVVRVWVVSSTTRVVGAAVSAAAVVVGVCGAVVISGIAEVVTITVETIEVLGAAVVQYVETAVEFLRLRYCKIFLRTSRRTTSTAVRF